MQDVKLSIRRFKQAVVNGSIEERRRAEQELKEAFKLLGLEDDLIKYLVANLKRYAEIEEAYERKCEELREVRELISKIYNMLF